MEPADIQFRTRCLNEAAFLWCQSGVRLETLEGQQRSQNVIFVFSVALSEADFRQLQMAYANGETTVEPLAFCRKRDQLRTMVGNVTHRTKSARHNMKKDNHG